MLPDCSGCLACVRLVSQNLIIGVLAAGYGLDTISFRNIEVTYPER